MGLGLMLTAPTPPSRPIGETQQCEISAFLHFLHLKGYQWLKERVNSEEGRRQLIKIKELHLLADRMSCTAAQLAIGVTPNKQTRVAKTALDPFNILQI